jgi:hypothetical protein
VEMLDGIQRACENVVKKELVKRLEIKIGKH